MTVGGGVFVISFEKTKMFRNIQVTTIVFNFSIGILISKAILFSL